MKKRIITFFVLAAVLLTGVIPAQSVQANDDVQPAELPSTFSTDITMDEIEAALNAYITENDLDIEVDTPEYAEFLLNLSVANEYPNINETQLRYFRAYASVYLANAGAQQVNAVALLDNGQKTIADIRQ